MGEYASCDDYDDYDDVCQWCLLTIESTTYIEIEIHFQYRADLHRLA
jgi:hypothetical protein